MLILVATAFLATAAAQVPEVTDGPVYYVKGSDLADGAKAIQRFDAGRARPEDMVTMMLFYGVVMATHDSFLTAAGDQGSRPFCTNKRVGREQLAAVVARYVLDNPERWHQPGTRFVLEALVKGFPCEAARRPESQ